ncbi:phytase-like protein with esterase activity [Cereibacter ovatus]|uniref:Phytase-like protein with esterase activity n=1 Tax=Cereibacter ovatus TaxID=439529 RepID=A0A285D498_9RHOB|nr:esterase-like activity of phytase family protein [Cereibacter ovatus]SNX74146.1 phytase-like protein with esterase activity [Cereibacter ovatus]
MPYKLAAMTSVLALGVALPAAAEISFNRIASFATTRNMADGEDHGRTSSAEIVSASEDGLTLVYTDSPLRAIGLIDITDPAAPKPLGTIDMGGEPTTAVILGGRVFAAVNTSESLAAPSGKLVTVDIASRREVASCDLGGQPDSVAKAPDGSFLAIAIENERDEDVNDGALPQMPAGYVVKLPIRDGAADCAALQKIDLTGLAAIAPEDPEPEFVSVNAVGEIAVTLQENNEIVVIGADGAISHFPAGAVDLVGIDTKKNGALDFTGSQPGRLREPDGIKWIDTDHFASANEGDWKGGARGWTIFRKDGTVVWESGASLERAIAAIGHYPEHRSGSKGVEIESVEVATFDGTPMAFVASERASVVAVYDLSDLSNPKLLQLLPSGVSPEGLVAIPSRNLLVTANEADLREDGLAPAHVMIFDRAEGAPAYPMITSDGSDPLIGWGALSGLAAGERAGELFAVSDSVFGMAPTIYRIDATQKPARIVDSLPVLRAGQPAQKLDLEGIALDGQGGFWLASEGRSDKLVPHAIYHVDGKGEITEEIALPAGLLSGETRFGFEGIARAGDVLWMAVQREWTDDPRGQVKLLAYDTAAESWGAVRYPLDAPTEGAWMGLSEITFQGDWAYLIERDNQIADKAAVKMLTRVALADLKPAPLGGDLPLVTKEVVRDLIPDLQALNGYVVDKVEGFAIDAAGEGWVVTDNDGTDDSSGETLFRSVGKIE